MLTSQSIPFMQVEEAGAFRLLVDEQHARRALDELRRYEEENRTFRLKRALPPAAPLAPAGILLAGALLVLFAFMQWEQSFGIDWLGAGRTDANAIRSGALYRLATALTLHADVPHLLSNLLFGTALSYLLFHAMGGGLGTLGVLLAGMLGNLMNAWFHAGQHLSIGASTAVFGAAGLLAGSEVRARHLLREPDARRFAPIFWVLVLLAYLGVGEVRSTRNVDVMAHVFGLIAGLPLGFVLGSVPRRALERVGFQMACGLLAAGLLAICWALALGR